MIGLQVLRRRKPRCQQTTWPRMLSATQTRPSFEIRGITVFIGAPFSPWSGEALREAKGACHPTMGTASAVPHRLSRGVPNPMTTNRVDDCLAIVN